MRQSGRESPAAGIVILDLDGNTVEWYKTYGQPDKDGKHSGGCFG